ncbi:raffinose/stachyose/melibiose transport system permease protein [Thermosporothrix hazakensis]|jgi:raffinose/stachyose/melibiose transport system permease protein|uniref:Raffinose/stachyose/melibiose transport system permease protein n=2 Tax=Thermosporothrix TaxID=768650 RepID=A0A326UJ61_THEHA|nr:sugar ABC transporter permease [Thermosporothrix hazakensis]PZW28469.1 raffinose/stachyose/melibiose transport system permease protein [Thermosporothrix hazakensis]BBH86340.1 ABC transporter [Thermosporothrix sp. COM3]GCE45246.1 ABC transporter [Thermosporothrix hazakensis]
MSASTRTAVSRRDGWIAVLWSLPALAFYLLFAIIPLFIAVYLSFTNWNGLSQPTWVGLQNWIALLSDSVTGNSLILTIEVMLISWIVQTPISLLLGVFMAGTQRYRAVLSVFYFLPLLFSAVAIGLTWVALLDPNFGLVNTLLKTIGLSALAKGWLGDPGLAFFVVMVIICWQFIPFHSLLYLGGARQIPRELYEASTIDGAGRLQQFFFITLPQLKYTVITSTTLICTGSLTYFDLFWVTTGGGPGYATRVLPLHMYITAFPNQAVGYGSVLAVVLALFGVVLSFVFLRFTGFTRMSSQLEGL